MSGLDPTIAFHIAAATLALALGGVQLARTKGTAPHRLLGWAWMIAMGVTAISSFGIESFMPLFLDFGVIHLLSIYVLAAIVIAIRAARRGHIARHRGWTVGAYAGLVGAAIGTLAPGRLIHGWLFG